MNALVSHKPIRFSYFTEHHLFVKNCPLIQLNSVIEELAGILYENQVNLIHGLISAPEYGFKQWNQLIDGQFDEPNWPIIWINSRTQNETFSGYFYGLSGISVLTLQSDFYLSKLFTTRDARFLFCGRIIAEDQHADLKQQYQEIKQHQQAALQFSEMNENHTVQTWNYVVEAEQKDQAAHDSKNDLELVNSITGINTPHALGMVSCSWAICPMTKGLQLKKLELNDDFSGLEIRTENYSKLLVNGRFNPSQTNQFIKSLELLLKKNGYTWHNLVRGIFWIPDGFNIKELKEILKSNKIPMYPQLMMDYEHSIVTWEADFVK